jgi:hypothetical protein
MARERPDRTISQDLGSMGFENARDAKRAADAISLHPQSSLIVTRVDPDEYSVKVRPK